MSNKRQKVVDLSSTTGSESMDVLSMESKCNDSGCELEKKLLEEKLKVAEMKAQIFEMKAEKEKAEMKAEMLKSKLKMLEMEKRVEEDARAEKLKKLAEEERLKSWMATGAGQLRGVSLLRVASNKLISFGGWTIRNGRLKATKFSTGCACVRAEKPFPVSGTQQDGHLLYFFEVTAITEGCNLLVVGLCGPDFPFTSTSITWVGSEDGSFSIENSGTYHASGKSVAGHGKGKFSSGDVIGCGLLVLLAERRLFFTKNGKVWGKPILLGPDDAKAEDLYPAVSAYNAGHEVEFNFGADLKAKPFKYDLTQLNVVDG